MPSLRRQVPSAVLLAALRAAKARFRVRIVHFAVLSNHVHLVVEASDKVALGRAMKGLCVRFARQLNRRVGRVGGVFVQRYHSRALKTPREVHRALSYVLLNLRHHENEPLPSRAERRGIDALSSAQYFDGWAPGVRAGPPRRCDRDAPVAQPTQWLLTAGWRRHGLIDPFARPLEAPRRPPRGAGRLAPRHRAKAIARRLGV